MSKLFDVQNLLYLCAYVRTSVMKNSYMSVTTLPEGGCSIIVTALVQHNYITRAYTQVQEASEGST